MRWLMYDQVDVWSFGVVVWEMLMQRLPYHPPWEDPASRSSAHSDAFPLRLVIDVVNKFVIY